MRYVIERVMRGDRREVPPDIPIGLWWDKFHEYAEHPNIMEVEFYHPAMEFLWPLEVRRVKAKALVWREVTGEWPAEIAWWAELRKARMRGDLPHTSEARTAWIDEDGVLHCGFEGCGARWSPNEALLAAGENPYPDRCKLCDRVILLPQLVETQNGGAR